MGIATAFVALLKRDVRVAFRHRNEIFNPLLFFSLVTLLFPLGIGPSPKLLQTIAPGILWVAALLAALLAADNLFRSDYEDGTLEQLVLSPQPLPLLAAAKVGFLPTKVPKVLQDSGSPLLPQ